MFTSRVVSMGDETGRVLLPRIYVADRFLGRFFGLMGRGDIPGDGLWLIPCNSIHMFFMRIPLDILFLDRNNSIIEILPDFAPWRLSSFYPEASSAVEIHGGKANELGLSRGMGLKFF